LVKKRDYFEANGKSPYRSLEWFSEWCGFGGFEECFGQKEELPLHNFDVNRKQ